jgi:hypothetical protein
MWEVGTRDKRTTSPIEIAMSILHLGYEDIIIKPAELQKFSMSAGVFAC